MNPFIKKAHEQKIAAAHEIFRDKGIDVGDTIKVSWDIDPAFAEKGHERTDHTGILTCLDSVVCVKPLDDRRGYLRLQVTSVVDVELVAKAPPPKKNPFLELAKQRGELPS